MSVLYPDLPSSAFPNSIQTFLTMLNMTASDATAVSGYQSAMQAGNTELAQTYYNQIANANQKFINANTFNTLMDTCVALQRFYLTDVQPYITTKQNEWQAIINKFNYMGIYNPAIQYQQNNFVLYNVAGIDLIFICTVTPPSVGFVPTNTAYWRQLTIQGLQGTSGAGLSFLYEWKSTTNYAVQDLVTYNDAMWGCIVSNSNQPPAIGSTYWQLIGTIPQAAYPFSASIPPIQVDGDLWFQIL